MTEKRDPRQPCDTSEAMLLDVRDSYKEEFPLEELEKFPPVEYRDSKDIVIMTCIAAGISQKIIGEAIGMTQNGVFHRTKRLDPTGMYKRDINAKKAIGANMALQASGRLYNYITEDKLNEASAKDIVSMQKALVGISSELSQSKHKVLTTSKLDGMLEEMEKASGVKEG